MIFRLLSWLKTPVISRKLYYHIKIQVNTFLVYYYITFLYMDVRWNRMTN